MGCLYSKSRSGSFKLKSSDNAVDSKTYSWSNKETVNPSDLIVENEKGSIIIKLPGTVNGQQFIIQNCENCTIYVLDHCNTITVDDCCHCNIFLGPTKGSVFVRDCRECRFMIACQQFRSRDCKCVDVYLCCATQPIIESCSEIRFGCFSAYYGDLEGQFKKAGLSIFNNNWSNIHDFTPAEGEQNWSLLSKDEKTEDIFPDCAEVSSVHFTAVPSCSLVPGTHGFKRKASSEICFVVFFYDGNSQKWALTFIEKMRQTNNILIQTKECNLQSYNAQRIFGNQSFSNIIRKVLQLALAVEQLEPFNWTWYTGPVIILIYNGDNCVQSCQQIAESFSGERDFSDLVYVSTNSRNAYSQLEILFSCGDMQMSD